MSHIFLLFYVLCTAYAVLSGHTTEAGNAVAEGAGSAVSFIIGITGAVCLWSGVMEVMERSGITRGVSRLLRPILRRLLPKSSQHEEIMEAVTENVSANLLGLGNAATPAGIRAAKSMARMYGGEAGNELCTFVVLNTASIQLLPTTIAAVRSAAGAASAFDIIPAVWISSVFSVCVGLMAAAILKRVWR